MWRPNILEEACRRFTGKTTPLQSLSGIYKNMYEYTHNGHPHILKLIPIAARGAELLDTELQWVNYLKENGISTPHFIQSKEMRYVEVIHKLPFPCCVISFKKLKGKQVKHHQNEWNEQLFRSWGKAMGKMHMLSKKDWSKQPLHFSQWNEGEIYYRDLSFAGEKILRKWEKSIKTICDLKQTKQNYGLIHNHLTPESFLVANDGKPLIFDFSHCKFHFFAYDISVALYDACMVMKPAERGLFKNIFLNAFIDGYQSENELDSNWKEWVDFFIEFRFLFLYFSSYLNPTGLSPTQKEKLYQMRLKIERGTPAFSA
ncbi:phosphotransferase enzyme family protein [Thermoflavimicrobium daqui]|uniref:Aminoglycoside phosphotransferase domain-containing protein n=1 Tax=Thermoflavimicrobium daqui TaxID=2137476 RepID=A0A364K229_9BACL|nr:phosphotransferase [Thermoflavimicrobium daqui]RAL22015.1 hypothetical protein DL897_14475 [Thermoflavimicrobium daqui]